MSKNVAIIGKNTKKYSGGRIHALMLAIGLTKLGYSVDYYTNLKPIFLDDFSSTLDKDSINFIINKYFVFKPKNRAYHHIIIIPHLNTIKNFLYDKFVFYRFVTKLKKINNSKLNFIDFESPNWILSFGDNLRSPFSYRNSDTIIKHVDSIVSSTCTGSNFAKSYYKKLNSKLNFHVLNPPVNSGVADLIRNIQKSNSVVFFARFGQKHKAADVLFILMKSLPKGFILKLVTNVELISDDMFERITHEAIKQGITLEFLDKVDDWKKFEALAEARVLVFSTKFEGFGLPPVEAQYMNTPVICSDLPVLREVNELALFDDFKSISTLTQKINSCIKNPPINLKESVSSFASFESFTRNLEEIL